MPSTLKRKGSPGREDGTDSCKRRFAEEDAAQPAAPDSVDSASNSPPVEDPEERQPPVPSGTESAKTPSNDRTARFAALRARNQASRQENLKETKSEARRAATDASQLHALHRKKDIAQHKLLQADVEAQGEDFERKRAWDWTIEESERWDERVAEKQRRRDEVAFADYNQEAGKIYERQVGLMGKKGVGWDARKEAYERSKREAIEASVRSGGLEIVETEGGELIAVDKDGSFYSTADGTAAFSNKPDKAAVDRLVDDIRRAETIRMKKRKERGLQDDADPDITYINEKNKQFNQKLSRFYDKYTAEIRENFERGTAI